MAELIDATGQRGKRGEKVLNLLRGIILQLGRGKVVGVFQDAPCPRIRGGRDTSRSVGYAVMEQAHAAVEEVSRDPPPLRSAIWEMKNL